jgi:rubrerythrin
MMAQPTSADYLVAINGYELAIAEVYSLLAAHFSSSQEYADFFNLLSAEEKAHSGWVERFLAHLKTGTCSVVRKPAQLEVVQRSTDYVKREKQNIQASKEPIQVRQALLLALNIESSMIEKRFFEVIASDDPELKKVFDRLRIETEAHADRVRRQLSSISNLTGLTAENSGYHIK